eukprot:gb/GECG01011814.1/.p1 GENE.gb/GECG01011814.1/~~gb/GECG01011814.1/.p1  ORF type:complete len:268 (+),score=29.28 gb/GECG01011814.1/:1-804(+)
MAKAVALVQGASRGIGYEFTRQLLHESYNYGAVVATARNPRSAESLQELQEHHGVNRLKVVRLDLQKEDTIQNAAEETRQYLRELEVGTETETPFLGLVINSSGFLHDAHASKVVPERKVEQISMDNLKNNFEINTFGPMLVAKHFMPLLTEQRKTTVFANMSARVGSIADNGIGGWYSYRASKAAQNQFTKTLSIEMKRRNRESICVALHPGTVSTGLSEPFRRNVNPEKLFSAAYSAEKLLSVIHSLAPEDTGTYLDYAGKPIPW